jgi:hypothetical protein
MPEILGWKKVSASAETALRVLVGEGGEIARRQSEDFCEGMADCWEIRGVVMMIWQWVGEKFCGRRHVWSIGF